VTLSYIGCGLPIPCMIRPFADLNCEKPKRELLKMPDIPPNIWVGDLCLKVVMLTT
jgi:hypothetical protein